jgi:peptidoglycan/xylan/chitin deacetylase (PgdA/CDA1 family)
MAPRPLILAYHAVSSTWQSSLAVPELILARQLQRLRAEGYVGLTFSEAERRRRSGSLPPRSLVVTFDDGYASTLRAQPILAELGFPGTVFVVTGFLGSDGPLRWPGVDAWADGDDGHELRPLDWEALDSLAASGWEIGSHTVTHPLLPRLADGALLAELEQSRETLVSRLGACSSVSYPYGVADERVAGAAARAGYDAACTLTWVELADEPHRRPRIGLDGRDDGLRLRLKLSAAGRALRRSSPARLARRVPRRRRWLPT